MLVARTGSRGWDDAEGDPSTSALSPVRPGVSPLPQAGVTVTLEVASGTFQTVHLQMSGILGGVWDPKEKPWGPHRKV